MELAELNLKIDSTDVTRTNKELVTLERTSRTAERAAGAFKRAVLAAAAATLALATAAVKAYSELENVEVTLTALTGSAEAARDILSELEQFGRSNPIPIQALREGAVKMKAFGFETEGVVDQLKVLSEAAAGLAKPGREGEFLERFVRTIGEIKSQGKLDNEDLRRLSELNVPGLVPGLAEIFGLGSGKGSGGEFRKAVEQGRVDAEDAILAIFDIIGRATGGLFEAKADTIKGQMQILSNEVRTELEKLGKAVAESVDLKGIIKDAIPVVREYGTVLRQAVQILTKSKVTGDLDERSETLAKTLEVIAEIFKFLVGLQVAVWFTRIAAAVKTMNLATLVNPWTALLATVIALSPRLADLHSELSKLNTLKERLAKTPVLSERDVFNRRTRNAIADSIARLKELKAIAGDDIDPTAIGERIQAAQLAVASASFPGPRELGVESRESYRERVASAFRQSQAARDELEAALVAAEKLLPAVKDVADETADSPLRFDLGANTAALAKQVERLRELRDDALFDLAHVGIDGIALELAEAKRLFDGLEKEHEGNAENLEIIAAARIARMTEIFERGNLDEILAEREKNKQIAKDRAEFTRDQIEAAERAEFELSMAGREGLAAERASLEFHYKNLLEQAAGNADAIVAIRRAMHAEIRQLEIDAARRLEREVEAEQFERGMLGLSASGRDRAQRLRGAQQFADSTFGAGTDESLRAFETLRDEIDESLSQEGLARVFDNVEGGLRDAFRNGITAAIFDEDWQAALNNALRRTAENALGDALDGLSSALIGKDSAGNQQSLFGAIFGAAGSVGGAAAGGGAATGGNASLGSIPSIPAAPAGYVGKTESITIFNVPDQATADSMLAKASAAGKRAAVASGSGSPGITSGRIKAGRK